MAPEMGKDQKVDEKVDVFAFSILLYNMFSTCPAYATTALEFIRENPDLSKVDFDEWVFAKV